METSPSDSSVVVADDRSGGDASMSGDVRAQAASDETRRASRMVLLRELTGLAF
jgi:hypothetical protein